MRSWLERDVLPLLLTPEQKNAVDAGAGAWLLVAPPGSGKTEVLIQRTIQLLEDTPEDLFRVLALTYTERAADELLMRGREALGEDAWRVTASTFHSFCLDLLRHYGEPVGVASDVAVYDQDLRAELLIDAIRDEGYELPDRLDRRVVSDLLARIDRLRVDLITPDLAPRADVLGGLLSLREAYDAYERALDTAHALDFDGMLLRGYRLLVEDPWVAEHVRRQYRFILVDEAQDLNLAQYEILKATCGTELRDVFVVADADQEIFSFTGASAKFLSHFKKDFNATRLTLNTNFRCAAAIVEASEKLRAHLRSSPARRVSMVPATPARGWVEAWSLADEQSEATTVAKWVAERLDTGLPRSWLHEGEDPRLVAEDICVMARTRYAFEPLTQALAANGLDYALRTDEGGLFDSLSGVAIYWGLRTAANPHDIVSRRRLISLAEPSTEVASESPSDGVAAADVLDLLVRQGVLSESLAGVLHNAAAGQPVQATIATLVDEGTRGGPDGQAQDEVLWMADRHRLGELWQRYTTSTRHDERSLAGFLRLLARIQRTTPDEPGVRLLTPYRAKGLQFRVVAIVGMNEGSFPYYRAIQSEREVDAERRTVYVAATRAARALLLTYPRARRTSWGNVRRDPPSRFIEEMGLQASQPSG